MKDAGDLFDQYAAAYEQALSAALAPSGEGREYFAEGRVAWLKHCVEQLRERPRAILDFGCGDGSTTPVLLRHLQAENAVGVDVSAKSLDIARKEHGAENIRYELISDLKSRDQMDLAYCNGVFHHILLSPPEARRLLGACGFTVLRTDFRFIFPHALRALRKIEDLVYRLPLGTQYQVLCRKLN